MGNEYYSNTSLAANNMAKQVIILFSDILGKELIFLGILSLLIFR